MNMRKRRRRAYQRTAYMLRLQELTAALEELADSLLRSEIVEIRMKDHAAAEPAAAAG